MKNFHRILEKAKTYNPAINTKRLVKAYEYVEKVNAGRYRLSGDPAISHYLAVAEILLSLNPDEDTLIAGLLHGIADSVMFDEIEFRKIFGDRVYYLVKAVSELKCIKSRDNKMEAESIRRMFIAMAKDLRVILIKLADRLHNMENMAFYPVSKQKQISRETMEIYVPISSRLGIYRIKSKLEDLSFQYLNAKQYQQLHSDLDEYLFERKKNIDDIVNDIKKFLAENKIKADVEGRIKNLYSIYRKMKLKNHSMLKDLYDVFAIRVILPDKFNKNGEELTDHLYSALGLIHHKWRPVAHRFKDYVAVQKPNGYSSLHTAVLGLSSKDSQVTEIQIRSARMHHQAEYGVASHWIYDTNKKILNKQHMSLQQIENVSTVKKYMDWIQALSNLQQDFKDGKDLLHAYKIDAFSDRIFVMTPSGDVKDLPHGATVIDFAYALDELLGHRCQSAKVNGSMVSLDYTLKNGEIVEIMQANLDEPKLHWLSFVKTSHAKKCIQNHFKSLDTEKNFLEGREMLNNILKNADKPLLDDDLSILRKYNGAKTSRKEREKLIQDVGRGTMDPLDLLKEIFGKKFFYGRKNLTEPTVQNGLVRKLLPVRKSGKFIDDQIYISGEAGMPYKLANCCKPRQGQPIVGYINRNNVVNIHLQKCRVLRDVVEERILDAMWGSDIQRQKYQIKLELISKNRIGLIRDIADIITVMNINILSFSDVDKVGDEIKRHLVIEVSENNQLEDILNKLARLRNVTDVRRLD